jgi:glycosyltransferase involved in cell wall biosynthesis
VALKNPLVTVCIPVHINHRYVLRAIESVLNQKYSNIELIISINSSTFDRNEILSLLNNEFDRIVKIIDSSSVKGVSFALNCAIESSRGEYFAWLSSDDFWREDHLSDHIDLLINSTDRVGLCCSGWYVVNEYDTSQQEIEFTEKENSVVNKFLQLCRGKIMGCAVTIKKEVFKEVGLFNEERLYTQDYEMWLRILLKYEIVFSRNLTTYYMMHGMQTTVRENVELEVTDLWRYIIENIDETVLESSQLSKIQLISVIFDSVRGSRYESLIEMLLEEMERELVSYPHKIVNTSYFEIERLIGMQQFRKSADTFFQLNMEVSKYGTLAHNYRLLAESQEEELKNVYNRKAIKLLRKLKYFN